MTLRFARLHQEARAPAQAHPGDAGYDLFAAESAVLRPGERASVGTGIAVAIPDGCAGLVLPRSGLAARHGITLPNAPGLIDSGYRGELRVLLLNTDPAEPFEVSARDPATFATVALILIVVSAVATYLPARRAAATDPLIALREEG